MDNRKYPQFITNDILDAPNELPIEQLLNENNQKDGFRSHDKIDTRQAASSTKTMFFNKQLLLKEGIIPPDASTIVDKNGAKKVVNITDDSVDVSTEELMLYMQLQQTKDIHTIKNCVVFFAVVAVIGLVGGFIIGLM